MPFCLITGGNDDVNNILANDLYASCRTVGVDAGGDTPVLAHILVRPLGLNGPREPYFPNNLSPRPLYADSYILSKVDFPSLPSIRMALDINISSSPLLDTYPTHLDFSQDFSVSLKPIPIFAS